MSTPIKARQPIADTPPDVQSSEAQNWQAKVSFAFAPQWSRTGAVGPFGFAEGASPSDTNFRMSAAALRYFNTGPVRFSAGPYAAFDMTAGGEDFKQLYGVSFGARSELDWTEAYQLPSGVAFSGPARLGIYAGLGYGWGISPRDNQMTLHEQSGLLTTLGVDANLFSVHVNPVSIDLDLFAQNQFINGSEFNHSGLSVGGLLSFRVPFTGKKRDSGCTGYPMAPKDFTPYLAENREVRSKNAAIQKEFLNLRKTLESQEHPLSTENIRDALYFQEMGRHLVRLGFAEAPAILGAAYHAKRKDQTDAEIDSVIRAGLPGLSQETIEEAKKQAAITYPIGFDFWAQLPGNPPRIQVLQPLPEDSQALSRLFDELLEERLLLEQTRVRLDQQQERLKSVIEFAKP